MERAFFRRNGPRCGLHKAAICRRAPGGGLFLFS
jgi:hypothetical protein